jgi:hypothetical protein
MRAHSKPSSSIKSVEQTRAEMEQFLADLKRRPPLGSDNFEVEEHMLIQPAETVTKLTEDEVDAVVGLIDELTIREAVEIISSLHGVFNYRPVATIQFFLERYFLRDPFDHELNS